MSYVDADLTLKHKLEHWNNAFNTTPDDSGDDNDVWFVPQRPSDGSRLERRCSAESVGSSGSGGVRSRKVSVHRRAATADAAIAHPLQASASVSALDAGVTRPTLRRWLSESEDEGGAVSYIGSHPGDIVDDLTSAEEETDVIIHQVRRKPFLRCNYLQCSFPRFRLRIHLRELHLNMALPSQTCARRTSYGRLIRSICGRCSTSLSIGQTRGVEMPFRTAVR